MCSFACSCNTGIDAANVNAIFEEHTISATLDPFNPVHNEFGTRERLFNFGAVIAQLAPAGGLPPPVPPKGGPPLPAPPPPPNPSLPPPPQGVHSCL